MPLVQNPATYFPLPNESGSAGLASVYIGEADTDPTVLINRINVTVIQEDGTPVVVTPNQQPFVLNAGGQFVYGGSVVQLRVDTDYSLTIDYGTAQANSYFPTAVTGESTLTDLIVIPALADDPTPNADGQVYTKEVAGIVELFYMDSEGQVVQITENGALKVNLPDAVIDVLGVAAGYYLGAVAEPTITTGVLSIDWQEAQYFAYTNTGAHTIDFSNVPLIGDGYGQTIMVAIEDAGNYAIAIDPSTGYTVYRRSSDDLGALTVDGLDILVCTVYNSGIVVVVPLLDFVPNV